MKTNRVANPKRTHSVQFTPPGNDPGKQRVDSPRAPVSKAEMEAWTQQVKDMPDIRWDKVKAMREAIQNHTIDTDDRLTNLAERLSPELIEYFRQIGQ